MCVPTRRRSQIEDMPVDPTGVDHLFSSAKRLPVCAVFPAKVAGLVDPHTASAMSADMVGLPDCRDEIQAA